MSFLRALGVGSFVGLVALFQGCSDDKPPAATVPNVRVDIPQGTTDGGSSADAGKDGGNVSLDTCRNTAKDADETDVDCGGGVCNGCALGKACKVVSDCADPDATCTNGICAKCHDNKTDGDETDIDCGGKACGPCTVGKACQVEGDCTSAACTANACACPTGMTIVSLARGGAYCIDSTEVTKGQYNKFITANVPVSTQTGDCAANSTFVPKEAWPPATPVESSFSMPVHYVNWCDAVAYCSWAKKQLCGSTRPPATGAAPALLALASRNDKDEDAWYNACSAQGTKAYPYGTAFDVNLCNTDANATFGGDGGAAKPGFDNDPQSKDYGLYPIVTSDGSGNIAAYTNKSCQGGSVGLYQMSGNVAEWEYACDGRSCAVRGGSSLAAGQDDVACAASRALDIMDAPADVGIRCCTY